MRYKSMSKHGKLFLFSDRNNIIVETSIDKIYIKGNNSRLDYKEVDPEDYTEPVCNFTKIVFVSDQSFNDMLHGKNKNGNKIISAVVKIGHKNDKESLKDKLKRIFSRRNK